MPLFNIFFIIFLIFFLYAIAKNLSQWQANNNSPVLTKESIVVDKRYKRHHHGGQHPHSSKTYYITFRVAQDETMEFRVRRSIYQTIEVGDDGPLKYQGTRFLSFNEG
jgi:hypothetical protein